MAEYGKESSYGKKERGGERGGDASSAMRTQGFFRRSKNCPFSEEGAPAIDYKDIKLLTRFVSERGKILPRRITSVSAKSQRKLAAAIKRARILALLPFAEH